jgi:hypothetical protein
MMVRKEGKEIRDIVKKEFNRSWRLWVGWEELGIQRRSVKEDSQYF